MGKLEEKVALVTGGTEGIGVATARRFVAEGAYVFITGRRQAELDAAAAELGPRVTAIRGDVANLADLDRLFAAVREKRGRLDILFANAGIAEHGRLDEVNEAAFDRQFDVNVKGTFFTVQKALPLLVEGASVILNSSIVGSQGQGALSVYSATKAALRSFARTWTTDLKPRRIRVNVVSPGFIDTPGLQSLEHATSAQLEEYARGAVPAGRLGRPEEIAAAVAFLASADASYITGSELFVDGGVAQM